MFAAALFAAALSCSGPASAPAAPADAHALLLLRDLSGLAVSPGGQHVAVQVQQANLETDSYRATWCIAPIAGGEAITAGDGGDMMRPTIQGLGRPTGVWATLAARWSPDSSRIAVLARRGDDLRIELCAAGAGCAPIIESEGDIDDLAWRADGQAIIFRTVGSRLEARMSVQREGDSGFLFDERFDVYHALTPVRRRQPLAARIMTHELDLALTRAATEAEQRYFASARRPAFATTMGASRSLSLFSAAPVIDPPLPARDVRQSQRLGANGAIWLEPSDRARAGMLPPLRGDPPPAAPPPASACAAAACSGRIVEFAPTPDGRRVFFIRREGWGLSQHGLYLWDIAAGAVQTLAVTDDVIGVCTPLAERAICLHEGPTSPRRVISIAFDDRTIRTVFDPNPALTPDRFVAARKLQWRAPDGSELFGYLLTPPDAAPLPPLIVVQYRATGFLRGGVGDEYPIQDFARRGFAVLVLERPDRDDLLATERDPRAFDRLEWRNLSERRRTMAALRSGIEHVVALGLADPARVGVTGLSDGAETAIFAAIHCDCAAAYAVSGGIHDPISFYLTSGVRRREMREDGRGELAFNEGALWPELSLSLNVDRVRAPILAHIADRELLFALQAHRTFTDRGKPFELYVFPDEYHVKWRPRHRAAIYARTVDWFAFWLQGVVDPDPLKAEQYARWRAWRD